MAVYLCNININDMIRSMTGFGKSQADSGNRVITVEVRSLNSKLLDINLRIPPLFREKEMEIRGQVSQLLERGKIDVAISLESVTENAGMSLNKALALEYYSQLKDLSASIPEATKSDILSILVRMPDVMKTDKEELTEEEWGSIARAIGEALHEVDKFRKEEGNELGKELRERVSRIANLLSQVAPYEQERVRTIRARFEKQLEEMFRENGYDRNRFEQELLFYLEKLDITEEKVRLKKHCEYFLETMNDSESPGKKLGFISQEIGREINTLGSKANDAHIQKIVVEMKDELEKIKEQLANIL